MGTGILDNISKGAPVDFSGNLSRGLKTAFGQEIPALGSIGGNNLLEPSVNNKVSGNMNAANLSLSRMTDIAEKLKKSINNNAANHKGVWSEDRTKSMKVGNHPANEMIKESNAFESAPAGMPDRRMSIVHAGRLPVKKSNLINDRDQYGYKSIPVVMQGVVNDIPPTRKTIVPSLRIQTRKGKRK
jgi:hypothetical protein